MLARSDVGADSLAGREGSQRAGAAVQRVGIRRGRRPQVSGRCRGVVATGPKSTA